VEDNEAICNRCGHIWRVKMDELKSGVRCADCRMGQSLIVKYGNTKCLPWQGEFDSETLTRPIYEDKPVLPGIRNCGHLDCVNPEHIKKA
jgi:DNA-directed RNA polymerase subunit RPC12/RpoP